MCCAQYNFILLHHSRSQLCFSQLEAQVNFLPIPKDATLSLWLKTLLRLLPLSSLPRVVGVIYFPCLGRNGNNGWGSRSLMASSCQVRDTFSRENGPPDGLCQHYPVSSRVSELPSIHHFGLLLLKLHWVLRWPTCSTLPRLSHVSTQSFMI